MSRRIDATRLQVGQRIFCRVALDVPIGNALTSYDIGDDWVEIDPATLRPKDVSEHGMPDDDLPGMWGRSSSVRGCGRCRATGEIIPLIDACAKAEDRR